MAVGVTGDFMPGLVDLPNLRRVMIWAFARKRRRAHHREACGYFVVSEKHQQAFCVFKLEPPPFFRAPSNTRAIGAPLRVIVPEEKEGPGQ
jgi:hypothetical protein